MLSNYFLKDYFIYPMKSKTSKDGVGAMVDFVCLFGFSFAFLVSPPFISYSRARLIRAKEDAKTLIPLLIVS